MADPQCPARYPNWNAVKQQCCDAQNSCFQIRTGERDPGYEAWLQESTGFYALLVILLLFVGFGRRLSPLLTPLRALGAGLIVLGGGFAALEALLPTSAGLARLIEFGGAGALMFAGVALIFLRRAAREKRP